MNVELKWNHNTVGWQGKKEGNVERPHYKHVKGEMFC